MQKVIRKSKFYCLLILAISTLFSCDKQDNEKIIWDAKPINISFYVQDEEGNDLLNPATVGNIAENDIKIIYDGKEYLRDEDVSETRALPATFRGLMTQKCKNEYSLPLVNLIEIGIMIHHS